MSLRRKIFTRISSRRRVLGGLAGALLLVAAGAVPAQAIVNGADPTPGKQPWVVQVRIGNGGLCGGTLVAPTKVVTAAQCVSAKGATPLADLQIAINSYQVSGGAGEMIRVTKTVIHPGYTGVTTKYANDVAVLTMAKAVKNVPLAIATPEDDALYPVDSSVALLGWGTTDINGKTMPKNIQKGIEQVGSTETCKGYDGSADFITKMCLVSEISTSCIGDSGGPVVALDDLGEYKKLIGIISYGPLPCKSYEVVTKVSAFSDFIQKQLGA